MVILEIFTEHCNRHIPDACDHHASMSRKNATSERCDDTAKATDGRETQRRVAGKEPLRPTGQRLTASGSGAARCDASSAPANPCLALREARPLPGH